MGSAQNKLRNRIQECQNEIKEAHKEIDKKVDHEEGMKLWKNFNKYAFIDEFQALYKRVVPAISSFEDKLKVFRDEH
eukprot:CAMPEP_0176346568 /NCGR_PEP_ID=MMETSP0126-20121128/6324_1 /TAXON_ID=141414 ORGANISM="Strombidinopsis acuminatum, Strain SPMC142" /NCGR_SAMPLE_ID=MMETSP0126 /ASSEMBLY_ACC=CAM_ASM_000229 /LENGTH=76 /DNA_ID=CAMNT_0017694147 /DNA_START=577 /DNA_END=807 /DNA_ORIENTATION=-